MKQIIGNKIYSEMLVKRIAKTRNPHGVTTDLFHLLSSKKPDEWFKNHPLVSIAESGKKLMGVAPEVLKGLLGITPNIKGATKVLINKLILNKVFLSMFVTNQEFRQASLQALMDYNESIHQGTTNISKTHQL